jgi:hypothetical protein
MVGQGVGKGCGEGVWARGATKSYKPQDCTGSTVFKFNVRLHVLNQAPQKNPAEAHLSASSIAPCPNAEMMTSAALDRTLLVVPCGIGSAMYAHI